jgi:hypothetical protein
LIDGTKELARLVKAYKLHSDVIGIMYPQFAAIGSPESVRPAMAGSVAAPWRQSHLSPLKAPKTESRCDCPSASISVHTLASPDVDWIINMRVYGNTVMRTLKRAGES